MELNQIFALENDIQMLSNPRNLVQDPFSITSFRYIAVNRGLCRYVVATYVIDIPREALEPISTFRTSLNFDS